MSTKNEECVIIGWGHDLQASLSVPLLLQFVVTIDRIWLKFDDLSIPMHVILMHLKSNHMVVH